MMRTRAAGLHDFEHSHVHWFAPHRLDQREHDVSAIEHGNRQHVQNREVHVQDRR